MPENDDLKNAWKSADKDGDGVPDLAENKIDSVPDEAFEHYEKIFQKDTTFWQRLGNFIRAENKAGRKAKIVKDGILVFAPWGKQVSDATELVTEIMSDNSKQDPNDMKDAVRGILSKEAWKKILVFTDEDGNFSGQETLTTAVQLAVIIGALYAADYFDVLDQFLAVVGLQ